jgi:octaprenyl-diphosphate synthase
MNAEFSPYLDRIESELKKALPLLPEADWKTSSFGHLSPVVGNIHISPLISPTRTLVSLGGKRWRPLLLVLCAQAESEAQVNEGKCSAKEMETMIQTAYHLTPLVEFVHTASLIHDDIEDSSDMRRGAPAAHITYGIDTALNAGSWLYFEAPVCIDTSSCTTELKEKLYSTYAKELRRLHLGQAMDIAWHRDNKSQPSVDEYLSMVRCKTGTLASLAAKIGILSANGTSDTADKTARIAADIGAGFQIIDDIINLTTGNPGKKRGDDIVEGKKSLPVLLYLEKNSANSVGIKELTDCFKQAHDEGIDSSAVEKAIALLEQSGVIETARKQGISLIKDGCAELQRLFGSDNTAVQKINTLFTAMIPGEAKSQGVHHA